MISDLSNKTIFLTGAGGLLGQAYVDLFLEAGAKVIASDLQHIGSERLISSNQKNSSFSFFELDVSSERSVDQAFDGIEASGLRPNVFVNNAAITGEYLVRKNGRFPSLGDTDVQDWNSTLDVNLTGSFLIAREMDKRYVGNYSCKLINVSSMYALRSPHHSLYEGSAIKPFCAYSVSKAGAHGLTIWLAGYWANRQCTVNTISPGGVFNGHSDQFKEKIGGLTMAGRMASKDEMANVMRFLCSDDSEYINGQMISVDGGFSAW